MTNPALGLLVVVYANIIIWSIVIMAAEAANPAPDESLRANQLRYTNHTKQPQPSPAPHSPAALTANYVRRPYPSPYSKPGGYIDAAEQYVLDVLAGRRKN